MYPSSVTICDLFAQTVRNYPDNLAVDHEQACLTYRELDNASTSLARKLQSLGITVASPIVLVTSHGSFNIIAILAILKSGSYFVPIDWDSWPAERIDQVLDTVQSPLVINTTAEPFSPGRSSCQVLNIDSLPYSNTMESNLEATKLGPHDTACVMFTSGSTGKPKGVMLSHKSLCLYSQTTPMNMNISPGDRVLHILSVAFDACACVLFSTLCNGGTVVPSEPTDLCIKASSCSVMASTPSLLSHLPSPTCDAETFSNMHTLIIGGETASADLLGSWVDAGIQTFVAYGLSETTSMGTMRRVVRDADTGNINPFLLGPFMEESPIYLLDQNTTQIVDENIDGEIFIGGEGVAKGYFNDEEKTKSHFIDWKGVRVYKTGDYARWVRDPAGSRLLEFVGRRDRIIKTRGFTVNLCRDVEEQLYLIGASMGVKSVHALATKDGIIAVVTPSCVDTTALLEKARCTMCSYFLPQRIQAVQDIPLSASGKAQTQSILDLVNSISNDKNITAETALAAAMVSEAPKAPVDLENDKLSKILRAAKEVLGCPGENPRRVTEKDSFVGMGGSSLLAIRFISKLRSLRLHLSINDLLSCQAFSEVAERASSIAPRDTTARWVAEDPAIIRTLSGLRSKACIDMGYDMAKCDIGPLTSLQLELAMPTLTNAAMNVNQIKLSYGKVHLKTAEKAWSAVWRAEPVFRTEILLSIGSGAIIVHKEALRTPTFTDYEDRSEYETAVRDVTMSVGLGCKLDFFYFRPAISNETRTGVIGNKEELTVVLTIHHSLMDGSSLDFLLQNVERASKGRSLASSTPSVEANIRLIATQRMHDQLARSFFKSYLKDTPIEGNSSRLHQMAPKRTRTVKVDHTAVAWFTPSVTLTAVTDFAKKNSVSAACIYYCAWAMAISAIEGSHNVVVGSVFSNRPTQANFDKTIGLYMATLPLVFKFTAGEKVADRLRHTMSDLIKLREFAWARSDQVGIGHRLSNILALQLPLPNEMSSPPPVQVETLENSDFPLSMLIEADGQLRLLYDERRFDYACVQRIGDHFKYGLCSILHERFIADCMKINVIHERLLAQADFRKNETRGETVKSALELSVDRFSQYPALEDHTGATLTYMELDRLSNIIAHAIVRGMAESKSVAVFGDGSINWVLSILGVLKTGRKYVPLDPKWSPERRHTVCSESGATVILFPTREIDSEALKTSSLKVFFTDSILGEIAEETYFPRLPNDVSPDDDLVAVYTSGSTGTPKGIPLTNRGILAPLRSCPEATMFAAPGRRIAQFMSTAFDYSNIEILCTLLHGATLVLRDPCDPYAHLRKVDTATITPSVLAVLNIDDYPNLELIYSTGEPITSAIVCKFSTRTLLYNVYGPAECSVVTSYTRVVPGDPITIGVAVPTARMYILDQNLSPVPESRKGELYVAGVQVMRGYLQAPDLSSKSVFNDPWFTGEHMYRTGDFGARGKDSRVTYLGRIDRQVKLRGFRVELAGVEQAIMKIGEDQGMTQCCAIAVNGTLIAFIACRPGIPILSLEDWIARLQDELKKSLFSASIPHIIMQLERFPVNCNGKVDVKALQSIYEKRKSGRHPSPKLIATDLIEAQVAEEWRQILQLGPDTQLSAIDNFFALGGHSVLVLLLVNRLSAALHLNVTLREMLPVPTFKGQVDLLKDLKQCQSMGDDPEAETSQESVTNLPLEELTELEQIVWHQCQVATTATAFNIVQVLYIDGPIDEARLIEAFDQALASDPVFRTNIMRGSGKPKRTLREIAPKARTLSECNINIELNRTLNLEQDALMHVLITSDDREKSESTRERAASTRVVIVASHAIVDLGSLQNLLRLVSQVYSGESISVYQTPRHLQSSRWTQQPTLNEQAWWKDYLEGHGYYDEKQRLLPSSLSSTVNRLYNGTSKTRLYSGKMITDLNARVRETGTTQHQLALATAALMLQWISGENDIILGAPDSGRRSVLERESCGQFLDRLPIRAKLPSRITNGQTNTNTILTGLRDSAHKALANAIPFRHILSSLGYPTGSIADLIATTFPLFECMVTFHTRSATLGSWLELHGCTVSNIALFATGSKFPLMLEWSEISEDQWSLHLEYDTDRISSAMVETIEKCLLVVLEVVSHNGTLEELNQKLVSDEHFTK